MNLLKIIFLFFCTWMTGELTAQTPFERYFLDKTLRFDYYHCGDSRNQEYFFDELKEEPYWAGSKVSLSFSLTFLSMEKRENETTNHRVYPQNRQRLAIARSTQGMSVLPGVVLSILQARSRRQSACLNAQS